MAEDRQHRERKSPERENRRFVSSVATLAVAAATGAGLLVPLYPAANKELSGALLILAVALGGFAVMLLTEAVNREREKRDWRAGAAIGAVLAVASLLLALLPGSEHEDAIAQPPGGLGLSLRPVEPEFFSVALEQEIPLPGPREDWSALRARGAVDVGDSGFHMILANDSPEPISVLSIRALVTESKSIPDGTYAWHPAQGGEALPQMTTVISSAKPGGTGAVFEGFLNPDEQLPSSTYFQTNYILLEPGEVYPVEMTVRARPARTIRYRFVASGESATRRFIVRSRAFKIVGWIDDPDQRMFARYYRMGYMPWECTPTPENGWVDVTLGAHSAACPEGVESPGSIPLPEGGGFIQRTPTSR